MMQHASKLRHFALALVAGTAFCEAQAIPNDFRVLTDELTEKSEFGFEFQAAMARPSGGLPLVRQGLAEVAYGLADQWEISVQLPVARADDGWRGTGANLELQHVARHSETGFYWGARAEIGRNRPDEGEAEWELEFRPIFGYRLREWHAVLNPGLTSTLSGYAHRPHFEPSAKLAYQHNAQHAVGIEYFVSTREANALSANSQPQRIALLTWDGTFGKADINFGIGKGLNAVSDRKMLKLLVSFAVE